MTNKPAKKKKPGEKLNNISPEYDSTREQTVLLENMYKDIKAIAEGHSILNQKLDDVNAKLDEHTKKLDEHSIRLGNLELDVKALKTATLEDSQRIKKLEQGQQRIEQKLDTVTSEHEQRLTKLEAIR